MHDDLIELERRPSPEDRSDYMLAQMRKGILEYCVLALIALEPCYGRALADTLRQLPGLKTTRGTIYPLLSRLRASGLVHSTLRGSPQGPARRYYRLTSAGHEALASFKRDWMALSQSVNHLMRDPR